MGGVSVTTLSGDQVRVRTIQAASRALGGALVGLGCAVLCGWLFLWQVLISVSPRFAPMKPNTALGFVATGGALWFALAPTDRERRVLRALSWFVLLLGGLTLLEYSFTWDLGIDRSLYLGAEPGRWPARMSISAASHFTLLGCALLLLDQRVGHARHRPSEWLAMPVWLSSFAALLGYLYGVESLYAIRPYSSTALHTTIAFQCCALGVWFSRPDQGLMRVISSSGPGGHLARRLLPPIVVIPVFLGWLRVKGQDAGHFGTAFGTAVFVASCLVCLSILVVSTAKALHAADIERRQAELKLQESEDYLALTLKSIGDGVITTNLQGLITSMNPVAAELTGFSLSDAIGQPLASVFKLLDELTREPIAAPIERILREGTVVARPQRVVLIRAERQRAADR